MTRKSLWTGVSAVALALSLNACDAATLQTLLQELSPSASNTPNTSPTSEPRSSSDPLQIPTLFSPKPTATNAPPPLETRGNVQVSTGSQAMDHQPSQAELDLAFAINQYRQANGLKALPVSVYLSYVAHTHSQDLVDNRPDEQTNASGQSCNLHSWSDKGPWSACCYTPDHAQSQCMWDKPGELTPHKSNGYEISLYTSRSGSSAEALLDIWKDSPGHNNVILNKDIWTDNPFAVMGIGIVEGSDRTYANVWFSESPDP